MSQTQADPISSNYINPQEFNRLSELWNDPAYTQMKDPDYQNFVYFDADPTLTNVLDVHPLFVCTGCNRVCFPPNIAKAKESSKVYKAHTLPEGHCPGGVFKLCCGFNILFTPKKYIVLKDSEFARNWIEKHKEVTTLLSAAEEEDKKPATLTINFNGTPTVRTANGANGAKMESQDVIEISDGSDSDTSIIGEPLTIHERLGLTQQKSPTPQVKPLSGSVSQSQPTPQPKPTLKQDKNEGIRASRINSTNNEYCDALEHQGNRKDIPQKRPSTQSPRSSPSSSHEKTKKRKADEQSDQKQKVFGTPMPERMRQQEEPPLSSGDYNEVIDEWTDLLIENVKNQVTKISNNVTSGRVSEKFSNIWEKYLDSGVPSFVSQMFLTCVKTSIERSCLIINNYSTLVGPDLIEVSESRSNLTVTISLTNTSNDCRLHWNIRVVVADDGRSDDGEPDDGGSNDGESGDEGSDDEGSDADINSLSKYQYLEQYEANDLTLVELCQFIIIQRTFLTNFITSLSNRELSPSESAVCQTSWRANEKCKIADHVALELIKLDVSKQLSHGT